jgi:hypothetical protein
VSAVHHQSRPAQVPPSLLGEGRDDGAHPGRDHPPPTLAELDQWADAIIPMLLWAGPETRPLLPTNLSLLSLYLSDRADARAKKAGAP